MGFDPIEILNMEKAVKKKWFISEQELDDEQFNILYDKDDNYLIEGCAGSGKTVLAIHRLMRIAKSTDTVLLVIYTKALKSFIESCIEANIFLSENVEIIYAEEFKRKREIDKYDQFDFVIIDEVQDLKFEFLNTFVKLTRKHFLLFGDDKQQIYRDLNGGITLEDIKRITNIADKNHKILEKNYRLPISVAALAGRILNDKGELVQRCTKDNGIAPSILKFNSFEEEIDYIITTIKKQNLKDVGIFYRNNNEVRDARYEFENQGFPVEYKHNIDMLLDFNNNIPKLLTYHSCKGLEFETVFLPSCSVDTEYYSLREALYVACTRPTKKLNISYINTLSPFIKRV